MAYKSETSKVRDRILKYCVGSGIDIGCNIDKVVENCIGFDKNKTPVVDVIGDATKLPYTDNNFDYVFSSHCLEDLEDPKSTLKEWLRVLKLGGKLILYLPHKDLYKGCNLDHKQAFVGTDIINILGGFGCGILEYFIDDAPPERYSFCVVATKDEI